MTNILLRAGTVLGSGRMAAFLSDIEFLTDPDASNDAFTGLWGVISEYLASAYQTLQIAGWCLLAICALVAVIAFGMFKDAQVIKEYKKWIIRIIGAAAGIALIMTIFGYAIQFGNSAKKSIDTDDISAITYTTEYNV